jgi:hypothetical protein
VRGSYLPWGINSSQLSKLTMAPASYKKSAPIRPAASVGSWHTKNVCLNSFPPSAKVTVWRPLTSRVFPVTPKGFKGVTFMSLLDTPGFYMDALEPVSTMSLLTPSMSKFLHSEKKSWSGLNVAGARSGHKPGSWFRVRSSLLKSKSTVPKTAAGGWQNRNYSSVSLVLG